MDERVALIAAEVNALLRERKFMLSTAESCTGGGVAAAITSCPGSSEIFKGAVVAYSNEVKSSLLGVSEDALRNFGAVSEETVREMVAGVSSLMKSDCAIATSGIAGPGGGTEDKPVGTVWVAVQMAGAVKATLLQLPDKGRDENIRSAIVRVLELLREELLGGR